MANFNTHLTVAAVGSGLCATIALAANAAPHNYLLTLTLAGTIGGILPDIDLENAVPSRVLFSVLGIILAFVSLFMVSSTYSIIELWIVWLAIYLFVRYGAHHAMMHITHHRGIFHSVLAGGFFSLAAVVIFDRVFGEPAVLAWLTGFFVLIGVFIHLVLDEIYSVDCEGKTMVKKSFGTALKLIDTHSLKASVAMGIAFAAMLVLTPSGKDFYAMVRTPTLFAFLKDRALPKNGWFQPVGGEVTALFEATEHAVEKKAK